MEGKITHDLYEKVTFHQQVVVSEKTFTLPIEAQLVINRVSEEIIMKFSSYVLAMPLEKIQIDVQYPETWWDAVKERWFPDWLKKWYPVEYLRVKIDETKYGPVVVGLPVPDDLHRISVPRMGF